MQRKIWFAIVALAIGLLVVAVPATYAQDEDFDKIVFPDETYTLAAGEVLSGNLAIAGGSVSLQQGSVVNGDVVLFRGSLVSDGTISGNVAAFGGDVTLGDAAVVEGSFASFGGRVERAPGATIRGETLIGLRSLRFGNLVQEASGTEERPPLDRAAGVLERFFFWQVRTFGSSLLMVILAVAVLLVAPKAVGRVASAAATQPAVSFGMGLLTLLLAAFAGALLLIACGLGLLIWLALLLALFLGWVSVGLWVGQRLLAAFKVRTTSSIAEVIVGVFLITVFAALPFCLGFFIWLIVGSIGLGAVVLTRFGSQEAEGQPAARLEIVETGHSEEEESRKTVGE